MSTLGPVIAVVLALIFAAAIALIAWKVTSAKFQRGLDNNSTESDDPPH